MIRLDCTIDYNAIRIVKGKGQLAEITMQCNETTLPGADRHWACSGGQLMVGPRRKMRIPIATASEEIAVVHNGIIANYEELKV